MTRPAAAVAAAVCTVMIAALVAIAGAALALATGPTRSTPGHHGDHHAGRMWPPVATSAPRAVFRVAAVATVTSVASVSTVAKVTSVATVPGGYDRPRAPEGGESAARLVTASPALPGGWVSAPRQPAPPPPPSTRPAPPGPGTPRPGAPAPAPTPGAAPNPLGADPPEPGDIGDTAAGRWVKRKTYEAMEWAVQQFVISGLEPLFGLLAGVIKGTPNPAGMANMRELWANSRNIALTAYVALVIVAGLVIMGAETLQNRYTLREMLPRILFGFVMVHLSLAVVGQATNAANALAAALLGPFDTQAAIGTLRQVITRDLVDGDTGAAMWLIVAVGALLVAVAAVLLGYVIRLAILAVLFVAGPLVLACYALPGAERAAAWWWRALAAVLIGQVGQALCLAIALRIFFTPGGIPDPASPINDPNMSVFAALGVIWLMGWLPFWMLRQAKPGGGNGLLGWFIASKTLGALGRRGSGSGGPRRPGWPRWPRWPGRGNPPSNPGGSHDSVDPWGPPPLLPTGPAGGGPRPRPTAARHDPPPGARDSARPARPARNTRTDPPTAPNPATGPNPPNTPARPTPPARPPAPPRRPGAPPARPDIAQPATAHTPAVPAAPALSPSRAPTPEPVGQPAARAGGWHNLIRPVPPTTTPRTRATRPATPAGTVETSRTRPPGTPPATTRPAGAGPGRPTRPARTPRRPTRAPRGGDR